jgi:hypothetical protein
VKHKKGEWALTLLTVAVVAIVLIVILKQQAACDGQFVRGLFWFECVN